jgi:DDE superfamily endonuclease
LLKKIRVTVPATRNHLRRVDYEYEQAGTASIFMFREPLSGWRQVTVRERRTKSDWAMEMEALLRTHHASAERVTLICDNLNAHTKGAFHETFLPEKAQAIMRRLDFRDTPQARKLAEHRRGRVEFNDASMHQEPPLHGH